MGLVKQISVSSNQAVGDHNRPYIRVVSVSDKNGYTAKLEIDVLGKNGHVSRKAITVNDRTDLYVKSGRRDLYEGYMMKGIDCTPGFEGVEFTNTEFIRVGEEVGGIDENAVKREQIYRTIETHLQKEMMYHVKGIKVLSLFFIDEVKKYRTEDGEKGIYAQMFEECYTELINKPRYALLKQKFDTDVNKAHDGYFSQDKKGHFKNTKGDSEDDAKIYDTIMKRKEWLLSFECPLRFIFSHSALKEGWDNPNVFQVCTLIEQKSTFTARQKVGRGLRLCVNQDGERIEDKNVNILHVMANESFTEFAETLQREIESDTGVKFGYVDIGLFEGITLTDEQPASYEERKELISFFEQKGYIKSGKAQNAMKAAIQNRTLELPARWEGARDEVESVISKTVRTIPVRDASKDVIVHLKKHIRDESPLFRELWDKIKQKTTYRVEVDTEELVKNSLKDMRDIEIPEARIISDTARVVIDKSGVSRGKGEGMQNFELERPYDVLPNVVGVLSERCLVTRQTANRLLRESGKIREFVNNPQKFIEEATTIINHHRHELAIAGIRYTKLAGAEYSVQDIFGEEELIGTLDQNAVAVENSVYDYVKYQSDVERDFAVALDEDPDVRMFFKIPSDFKIDTPIGTYNPDWAVYVEQNGEKKLYFVLETKGTTNLFGIRPEEKQKILCGKAHFKAVGEDVKFNVARSWTEAKN
jgi:type III restriction enzyme